MALERVISFVYSHNHQYTSLKQKPLRVLFRFQKVKPNVPCEDIYHAVHDVCKVFDWLVYQIATLLFFDNAQITLMFKFDVRRVVT